MSAGQVKTFFIKKISFMTSMFLTQNCFVDKLIV